MVLVGNPQENISVRVFDILGKTLINKTISGSSEIQLDLGSAAKGIMFVEVQNGEETFRSKILVQ
jgi:hypothetical protein